MMVRITEYLDIDLDSGMWCCYVCRHELIAATKNYKEGCVVYERDPKEIYPPVFPDAEFNLSVADGYGVFIEFYCPGCGTMIENELLPEGHPPAHDIELDLEALRAKYSEEK